MRPTARDPRPWPSSLLELPPIREVHPPQRWQRLPRRWADAGVLLVLLVIAAYLHSRQFSGQYWFNEAIAVGIAQQPFGSLLSVIKHAGSAPLYYLLLHFWVSGAGSSEAATHALSLLFALVAVPIAFWTGHSFAGRRGAYFAALLVAFSSFLTRYGQETQPYTLMMLLGLLATAGFLHAYVYRRRGYLWLLVLSLAAMFYTQTAAALFWLGCAVALALVVRMAEPAQRRRLLIDGAIGLIVPVVLFVPWLPATIYQINHATAPWHYTPLLGADVPADLLGGERVNVTLLVAVFVGGAPFLIARTRRRSREGQVLWALIVLPVAALLAARLSTLVTPGWNARYFAPMVAPLLVLGAVASARARLVGVAAVALCFLFLLTPSSFSPQYKSDMRDITAEIAPQLHANDLVVVGQPEQTPLVDYYLPAGLRYASTAGGLSSKPMVMRWTGAFARLRGTSPAATLQPLVASLRPGQQLLFVRPFTEGVHNWKQPWTKLVRRRSAQWGAILTQDVASGMLKLVSTAPHNYRGACCVGNEAALYVKTS